MGPVTRQHNNEHELNSEHRKSANCMNISNITLPPVGLSSKRSTQHKKPLTLVVRVFGGWAVFNRPKVIQLDINDADGLQSAEQFRLA